MSESLAPIATPLANDRLTSKLLKLIKKATKEKQVKRGVKEVVKVMRKTKAGQLKPNKNRICVIAGNISPIDVLSHIPVLCEDNNIDYIYVPSKEDLGASSGTKRPTSCALVDLSAESEHIELLKECKEKMKKLSSE
eukprot:TRINITY_DN1939_c0_g1_i1.p1 TRINITY_DN1939_c0_g1~~TRINITY_DN1939_c0_g1_i1.p1  ORF type:complete len:147 (-),score=34.37 TRINITY_DN1939_c0_g1_i1:49-459(-)